MDPMLGTAALAAAEKIINTALVYDPGTRIGLEQLAPQVLAVHLTAPDLKLFLVPAAGGINLRAHYEGEITTQLHGTLPAMLSLIKSNRLNLRDSGVQLFGSTNFLAQLHTLLKNLDLDWEEMLSQFFGDVIGHQSATLIRKQTSWAKDRAANFQRLTSEFLTEELSVLPTTSELAFFNAQVDELKLNADRVTARIDQILARIERKGAQ